MHCPFHRHKRHTRVLDKRGTCCRDLYILTAPYKKRASDMLFEFRDLLAECRLCNPNPIRRARKIKLIRNRDRRLHMTNPYHGPTSNSSAECPRQSEEAMRPNALKSGI
jgi:hypothetical protein